MNTGIISLPHPAGGRTMIPRPSITEPGTSTTALPVHIPGNLSIIYRWVAGIYRWTPYRSPPWLVVKVNGDRCVPVRQRTPVGACPTTGQTRHTGMNGMTLHTTRSPRKNPMEPGLARDVGAGGSTRYRYPGWSESFNNRKEETANRKSRGAEEQR